MLDIDLDELDSEIEQLRFVENAMKPLEKKRKELRESILLKMNVLHQDKLEGDKAKITKIVKGTIKLSVDPTRLPARYQSVTSNNSLLKEDIENGVNVPGVSVEYSEYLKFSWKDD